MLILEINGFEIYRKWVYPYDRCCLSFPRKRESRGRRD